MAALSTTGASSSGASSLLGALGGASPMTAGISAAAALGQAAIAQDAQTPVTSGSGSYMSGAFVVGSKVVGGGSAGGTTASQAQTPTPSADIATQQAGAAGLSPTIILAVVGGLLALAGLVVYSKKKA